MIHFLNHTKLKFIKGDRIDKKMDIIFENSLQYEFDNLLDVLEKSNITKISIGCKSPKDINKSLNILTAGGGLVVNEYDELLLIFRRGAWDLPKGKKEKNETIELTACREVMEETGIVNCSISRYMITSYHWYKYKKKWTLKESVWYIMNTNKQLLFPQEDEDITKAIWVPIHDLPKYFQEMHTSIIWVLRKFYKSRHSLM